MAVEVPKVAIGRPAGAGVLSHARTLIGMVSHAPQDQRRQPGQNKLLLGHDLRKTGARSPRSLAPDLEDHHVREAQQPLLHDMPRSRVTALIALERRQLRPTGKQVELGDGHRPVRRKDVLRSPARQIEGKEPARLVLGPSETAALAASPLLQNEPKHTIRVRGDACALDALGVGPQRPAARGDLGHAHGLQDSLEEGSRVLGPVPSEALANAGAPRGQRRDR